MTIGILSFIGYVVVMLVSTVVLAAAWTGPNGKVDGFNVWGASILWPFTIVGFMIYGVGLLTQPFWRFVHRSWRRSVLRLNPEFQRMK